jgi:uncharacterized protein (TIGR03663 family)
LDLSLKDTSQPNILARLTVEQVLYGLLVLLAAVIRLPGLGGIPLSPAEATEALSVYDFWQPGATAVVTGSSAYFSLTSLLTPVLGFSDSVMRLVPVLFGLALPILPWFLRHRLGSIGALVTSLFLVLSPVQSLLSRTSGGQSIALFSGFLLFIAWLRYQESDNPRWLMTAVIALALGLSSAPIFYSLLISFLLAWLVTSTIGPALMTDEEGEPRPMLRPSPEQLRQALIIGGAVFAAVATLFLWNLSGFNGVARNIGDWLTVFLTPTTLNTWLEPIMALGRYEFILLFIGGPAVIWAVWHGRPFPSLLVYWITSALLLILVQRGFLENLAVLTIPGYLLVGRFIGDQIQGKAGIFRWALVGMILVFGMLFYFNLVRFSRLAGNANNLGQPLTQILIISASLLLLLIAFYIVWNVRPSEAKAGTAVGLLIVLLFFTWGTTWNLTQHQANDTRERLIRAASDDDLPLLAATIREVSRQTRNADNNLEILMTIDNPALRWYLRDFENLIVDGALPRTISSEALITPMESIPSLETGYVGTDFGYYRPETEHILSLPAALQWWFFHHSAVTISEERAIFWLRADLAGENFQPE